jgi:hypothetical protein
MVEQLQANGSQPYQSTGVSNTPVEARERAPLPDRSQSRRDSTALATSPMASTDSPQSEKQTMRHGHASRPS